jgi:RND family efflux transporter MFP subunit
MKLKPTRRALVIAAVVAALLAVIIVPRLLKPADTIDAKVRLAPVLVASPKLARLPQILAFSGHLKAGATTTVISKVPGKVLQILVRENQKVNAGQLVARIEDDVVRLQMEQAKAGFQAASAQLAKATQAVRPEELESAKASLAQAEQDLAVARNNLERTKNLYESGTIAKSKYEDAQNQLKNGETKLDNARRQVKLMEEGARKEDIAMAQAQADSVSKQLALAELQLDFASVRAPISGTVAKVHVDPGNMVGQTSPLITIFSDGTIFAQMAVPEQYYGFFNRDWRGFEVQVNPLAYRDKPPFHGSLTDVSSFIDGNTRTFEVDVAVENPGNQLKPGMYVDVSIGTESTEETLLVPANAVLLRNGVPVVFTTDDASDTPTVTMHEVETGQKTQALVQILKGIKAGDRVVIQGNAFLETGQKVGISKSSANSESGAAKP